MSHLWDWNYPKKLGVVVTIITFDSNLLYVVLSFKKVVFDVFSLVPWLVKIDLIKQVRFRLKRLNYDHLVWFGQVFVLFV